MFSIQKRFAKDDEFLELLQQSAQAGRASIQALKEILKDRGAIPSLDAFAATRRKDKAITGQITELLARSSITSLDREDIEEISTPTVQDPENGGEICRTLLGLRARNCAALIFRGNWN